MTQPQTQNIILYGHPISQPSRSVYWITKIIEVPVTYKTIQVFKGENKTEEYSRINPNHQIPAIDDNGFILFERYFFSKNSILI
jgi:glutathione S-transferase